MSAANVNDAPYSLVEARRLSATKGEGLPANMPFPHQLLHTERKYGLRSKLRMATISIASSVDCLRPSKNTVRELAW